MSVGARTYLSFGGGVNSTALMLLLLDRGEEFEAVYADHGCDWPDTAQYVEMLQRKGYQITVLETRRGGLPLYQYYWKYRIIPMRAFRHCTDHFKSRPIDAYVETPCVMYLGIAADEAGRAARYGTKEGQDWQFPLLDERLDRSACEQIIRKHELAVPIKSGCFVCPFQTARQWKKLRREEPDLFCKAVALEERATQRRAEKGKAPITLFGGGIPLWRVVQEEQMELPMEGYTTPPCNCGL